MPAYLVLIITDNVIGFRCGPESGGEPHDGSLLAVSKAVQRIEEKFERTANEIIWAVE